MMQPEFPSFAPLRLSDQAYFSDFVRRFPPYSDFDFASLWSWNVTDSVEWCVHRGNLVVSLGDYTTGKPLLSMLGDSQVNDAVEDLLSFLAARHRAPCLSLIPETTAARVDITRFQVEPDIDSFDYVYDVDNHVGYTGPEFANHRRRVRTFAKRYGAHEARLLKCGDPITTREIEGLWKRWEEHAAHPLPAEFAACRRFLSVADRFDCLATGIYLDGRLVAFDITALDGRQCGNLLFTKGDLELKGIYSVLRHEVAKRLRQVGCRQINFEQDLGLPGLRLSKRSFRPVAYLKKFRVRRGNAR